MSGPHDTLFRETFSKLENAAAELRRVLPADLVRAIDFDSLTLLPTRFADENLQQLESDMLFSARVCGEEALIYVLCEHQSSVDRSMIFRLLRYMASAWEQHLKEQPGMRVPPIIPLVVHHSDSGWTAPTSLRDALAIPHALEASVADYTPHFRFVLHDLAKEDLDALREAPLPPLLKLVLFLLQRTRHNPQLDTELLAWVHVARQLDGLGLQLIMSYIWLTGDLEPEPIADWAHVVGIHAQEAYVTTAEKFEQRLRAKYLAEGRLQGQAEGRMQGQAEGRMQGQAEGQRRALRQLLERRFGRISATIDARVAQATETDLEAWLLRVLEADTLDAVFE